MGVYTPLKQFVYVNVAKSNVLIPRNILLKPRKMSKISSFSSNITRRSIINDF